MFKKIEMMEKKFEKFEKAQNEMKEILQNRLISTQFIEEEIIIDIKYVNAGAERMILIDSGAFSSKWAWQLHLEAIAL